MTNTKLALLISASLLLPLLLSGCGTTTKSPSPQKAGVRPDTAAPNIELSEAAVSISRSLSELAAIEKASKPAGRTLVTAEMPGKVSVDWSGPVEPLLKQIASISDYRLRLLGVRPAIPVLISMNAKDMPLADVIRNIDAQSGNKATVVVYPHTKTIELRYRRA